ncbi:unnamed protein product, partial [Leptidea sinapis]
YSRQLQYLNSIFWLTRIGNFLLKQAWHEFFLYKMGQTG